MKRMITQELINKVNDLLENIFSGVLAPNKIQLDSVADLEIADLGSLFPTAENGKLLAWNNGVLANADVPSGGTQWYSHKLAQMGSGQVILIITPYSEPLRITETSNVNSKLYLNSDSIPFFIKGYGTLSTEEIVVVAKQGPTTSYNLAIKGIDFTNSQITYTDITLSSAEEEITPL